MNECMLEVDGMADANNIRYMDVDRTEFPFPERETVLLPLRAV